MATHYQTAMWSGSGECQNIGVVKSFEGKKGGGQLETENKIGELLFYSFYLTFIYTGKLSVTGLVFLIPPVVEQT